MARMQEAGNRVLETDYIKIHGNCLEIENTVLQLKNISLFSTVDIDSHPFPMGVLLLIIAAIVSLFFKVLIAVVLFAFTFMDLFLEQKRTGAGRNQTSYHCNKLRSKFRYYIFKSNIFKKGSGASYGVTRPSKW